MRNRKKNSDEDRQEAFANQCLAMEEEEEEDHACSAKTSMKPTPKAPLRMAMGHRLRNLPYKACQACPDTGAS